MAKTDCIESFPGARVVRQGIVTGLLAAGIAAMGIITEIGGLSAVGRALYGIVSGGSTLASFMGWWEVLGFPSERDAASRRGGMAIVMGSLAALSLVNGWALWRNLAGASLQGAARLGACLAPSLGIALICVLVFRICRRARGARSS